MRNSINRIHCLASFFVYALGHVRFVIDLVDESHLIDEIALEACLVLNRRIRIDGRDMRVALRQLRYDLAAMYLGNLMLVLGHVIHMDFHQLDIVRKTLGYCLETNYELLEKG